MDVGKKNESLAPGRRKAHDQATREMRKCEIEETGYDNPIEKL